LIVLAELSNWSITATVFPMSRAQKLAPFADVLGLVSVIGCIFLFINSCMSAITQIQQ